MERVSWATHFPFKTRSQDKKIEGFQKKLRWRRGSRKAPSRQPSPPGRQEASPSSDSEKMGIPWGRAGTFRAGIIQSMDSHKLEKKALDPAEIRAPMCIRRPVGLETAMLSSW